MKQSLCILILFTLLFGNNLLLGQVPDSISNPVDTTSGFLIDSLPVSPSTSGFRISKDSLDAKVEYNASDSMILDNVAKKAYLYGDAFVSYKTTTLKAGFIVLEWENNVVMAKPWPDSSGQLAGKPNFQDGEQNFTADSLRYNFKSGKGIVYDVRTQQGDVIVIGAKTKFIKGERIDTSQSNDVINNANAIFTTCTNEDPHFGIRSTKQKVIPNRLVVVGPSQLEIMGVPTPLWLPFGFFPVTSGRRTGLIFPNDYEYSPQFGFGLRGVGWFFPLGEHFNLTLTSNIYLKGSFGMNAASTYNKRYKYSGNFSLGFDSRKQEDLSDGSFDRSNSFSLRWSHRQDQRAHPTNNFGGSINIQTNDFQSRVYNDASNVLNTQLSSNLTFTKNWTDKPLNFSAGFSHTQNNQTRQMTINFPNLRFQTQSLYPFKKPGGKDSWVENTVVRYSGEMRNRFQTPDSLLFTQKTWDDAQIGARHDVTMGNSFKLLRYFNLNPSVSYQEVWYLKSLRKEFDPTQRVRLDTVYNADSTDFQVNTTVLDYGTVNTDTIQGFNSYRTFSTGVALNTRIFSTLQLKKGFLRGIRYELRPTISLNYSPNYLSNDNYFREVQRDVRFPEDTETYSIFDGNIFGAPPRSEEQMAISYSLNNIFLARVFSKRDSTLKKVKLIDNIVINGNYNFAADSLKWSRVSMRTTARFFKGITTVGFGATFDPYEITETGRRIDKWVGWRGILPVRFDNATLRITSNITVSKLRAIFQGKEEEVVTDRRQQSRQPATAGEQDFLSLFENFNISHNIAFNWTTDHLGNTELEVRTNAINARGNIQLTKFWGINVGNFGYDFVRKGLSYPSIGITRDLHCWIMTFNWAPTRGTYNFSLAVKPGSLDFIKLPYQRNNYDTRNAF